MSLVGVAPVALGDPRGLGAEDWLAERGKSSSLRLASGVEGVEPVATLILAHHNVSSYGRNVRELGPVLSCLTGLTGLEADLH